jgi:hypothetical protein
VTSAYDEQDLIGTLAVKQQLDAELEAIRESENPDPREKRQAEATAAERVRAAELDLFKVSSGHAEFRAAYNEAAFAGFGEPREVWEAELDRMLARAETTADEKMADAIFMLSIEEGFDAIGEKYLARRPDKQKRVGALTVALEEQKRVNSEIGWARGFPLRRPHEYDERLSDKERVKPSERIARHYRNAG